MGEGRIRALAKVASGAFVLILPLLWFYRSFWGVGYPDSWEGGMWTQFLAAYQRGTFSVFWNQYPFMGIPLVANSSVFFIFQRALLQPFLMVFGANMTYRLALFTANWLAGVSAFYAVQAYTRNAMIAVASGFLYEANYLIAANIWSWGHLDIIVAYAFLPLLFWLAHRAVIDQTLRAKLTYVFVTTFAVVVSQEARTIVAFTAIFLVYMLYRRQPRVAIQTALGILGLTAFYTIPFVYYSKSQYSLPLYGSNVTLDSAISMLHTLAGYETITNSYTSTPLPLGAFPPSFLLIVPLTLALAGLAYCHKERSLTFLLALTVFGLFVEAGPYAPFFRPYWTLLPLMNKTPYRTGGMMVLVGIVFLMPKTIQKLIEHKHMLLRASAVLLLSAIILVPLVTNPTSYQSLSTVNLSNIDAAYTQIESYHDSGYVIRVPAVAYNQDWSPYWQDCPIHWGLGVADNYYATLHGIRQVQGAMNVLQAPITGQNYDAYTGTAITEGNLTEFRMYLDYLYVVEYVVVYTWVTPADFLQQIRADKTHFQLIGTQQGIELYRNLDYTPKPIIVLNHALYVGHADAPPEYAYEHGLDPKQAVLVTGTNDYGWQGKGGAKLSVEWSTTHPYDHIKITTDHDVWLLVPENNFPNWIAYANGERLTPALGNGIYPTWHLSAGNYTIEVRYEPPLAFNIGAAISIITLACIAAVAIRRRPLASGGLP